MKLIETYFRRNVAIGPILYERRYRANGTLWYDIQLGLVSELGKNK